MGRFFSSNLAIRFFVHKSPGGYKKKQCEKSGTIKNILLGIGGGFVGGIVFKLIGFAPTNIIGTLLVSVVGACICIWGGRKLFK